MSDTDRPAFPGAFCSLCGNTNVADLGQVIGICLDASACHRRQLDRHKKGCPACHAENTRAGAPLCSKYWALKARLG